MSNRLMRLRPGISRVWLTGTLVLVAWGGLVYGVVPEVIRRAYEGRALPVLNAMLAGRAQTPVAEYLDSWRAFADGATLRVLVFALAAGLLWEFRRPTARWLGRTFGGTLSVPGLRVLQVGCWLGLMVGVVEAVFVVLRTVIDGKPHWFLQMYSAEVVWMAPLGGVLVLGALAALAGGIAVLLRRRVPVRLIVFLGMLLGLWSLLREARFGLHPVAVLLLVAGLSWQLATLAGRVTERRLVALMRRTTWGVLAIIVALGAGIPAGRALAEWRDLRGARTAGAGAPSVLLLILDTVGARNLSLYGHERPTTPGLTALASSAVVFEEAVSPAPWTLTAHAAMFTGEYPEALEVNSRSPLARRHETVAEVFRAAGYATAGFVANQAWATRRSGLEQGFGRYDDRPISPGRMYGNSAIVRYAVQEIREHLRVRIPRPRTRSADEINAAFLAWRDRIGDRPFFAFLNYIDGHSPYHAPGRFGKRFSPDTRRTMLAADHYSRAELVSLESAYDEAIAYLDDRIVGLLDSLRTRGLLDQTVVVVTSDHGEQFGLPRLVHKAHGLTLYRPVLQVPLLIRYPAAAPPGRRIPGPVSTVDVAATLLDLAGLDTAGTVGGRSLARYWNGQARTGVERPVLSEVRDGGFDPIPAWSLLTRGPMKSLVEGRWHYIVRRDGGEEVYDLTTDPWEQVNLRRGIPQDTLERLRTRVAEFAPWR